MTKDKLSMDSSATDILNKVNESLANKQAAKQEDDVLELVEEVKANNTTTPQPQVTEAPGLNPAQPAVSVEQPPVTTTNNLINDEKGKKMTEKLVSENTADETSALLKQLKQSTNRNLTDGLGFNSGTTVEEIVTELIKPQISTWLDQNLPAIVKHVVEKEVKKLLPTED